MKHLPNHQHSSQPGTQGQALMHPLTPLRCLRVGWIGALLMTSSLSRKAGPAEQQRATCFWRAAWSECCMCLPQISWTVACGMDIPGMHGMRKGKKDRIGWVLLEPHRRVLLCEPPPGLYIPQLPFTASKGGRTESTRGHTLTPEGSPCGLAPRNSRK